MPDPEEAAELQELRALLADSGAVLETRSALDSLALDVLAAPGLGECEVRRLRTFVEGPSFAAGTAALHRLIGQGNGTPS